MAGGDVQTVVEKVLQGLSRHLNCLSEENRNTRKRAIQGIGKGTLELNPSLEPEVLQCVLTEIIKPVLKLFSDPTEKCRELSILFLSNCMDKVSDVSEFLPMTMPVLVQRLGQHEVIEPSEELRLEMIQLLSKLVRLCQQKMSIYLDDVIRILQRGILDPYSEVKKESCRCSSLMARATKGHFHMQSEHLIKPLAMSISHQHSRVRVEVIKAIGMQFVMFHWVNMIVFQSGKPGMSCSCDRVHEKIVNKVANWPLVSTTLLCSALASK